MFVFFFKQKTAYEMRISDWSSDVCSSDLVAAGAWSHRLAAQIGDKVPLESERGYHMVVGHQPVPTRRPVSFIERRFMATTMNMEIGRASCRERVCQYV